MHSRSASCFQPTTRALKTLPGHQPERGCDPASQGGDGAQRSGGHTGTGREPGTDLVQPRPSPAARGRGPAPSLAVRPLPAHGALHRAHQKQDSGVPGCSNAQDPWRPPPPPPRALWGTGRRTHPPASRSLSCCPPEHSAGLAPHLSLLHFQMRRLRLRVAECVTQASGEPGFPGGDHGSAQGQGASARDVLGPRRAVGEFSRILGPSGQARRGTQPPHPPGAQ